MAARWYVIHVYSGFENKVSAEIQSRAARANIAQNIEEIWVPTQEVVEIKRGQKVNTEQKFYPGYVLIKMEMNDETWHLVRDTPRVTGFLGATKTPSPITEKEALRLINHVKEGAEKPKTTIQFDIGESVRVTDGPFTSFNGLVEDVDHDRSRLKVSVSIFGRSTPVELEYTQVEKV